MHKLVHWIYLCISAFINVFTHSLNKYLFSCHQVTDNILGIGNTAVDKSKQNSIFLESFDEEEGKTINKYF